MSKFDAILDIPDLKKKPFEKKRYAISAIEANYGMSTLIADAFPAKLGDTADFSRARGFNAGLENEVEWMALILERYASDLIEFNALREELEQFRGVGNWQAASVSIESMRNRFGASFYIYERRIEYAHQCGNPDIFEEKIGEILEAEGEGRVGFFIAANYFRFHPLYPYAGYSKILQNNITKFKDWGEVHAVNALYHVDSASPLSNSQMGLILSISGEKPIIDQYELLIYVLTTVDAGLLSYDAARKVRRVALFLLDKLKDKRLSCRWNPSSSNSIDIEHEGSLERLSSGCICAAIIGASEVYRYSDGPWVSKNSFQSELANILSGIHFASSDRIMLIEGMRRWASAYGRCAISKSLFELSRYLSGHIEISEVSLRLAKRIATIRENGVASADLQGHLFRYIQFEEFRDQAKKISTASGVQDLARFIIEVWSVNPWAVRVIGMADLYAREMKRGVFDDIRDFPAVVAFGLLEQGVAFTATVDAFLFFLNCDSVSRLAHLLPLEYMDVYKIFIENCCGLSVIKDIPCIGDTMQEVRSERVKLLKYLIAEGHGRSDALKNEVFELEKRNRIDGANIIIDQSRMMIDRSLLEKKIGSFFLAKLGNAPVDEITPSIIESLQTYAIGLFLLDQDCGLDAVLSGRVRHGNLRERLRSPFSRNGLAFLKRNGRYEPPDQWWNTFLPDDEDRGKIIEAITDLSRRVDDLINRFIKERIQFRMEDFSADGFSGMLTAKKSPDGLFDTSKLLEDSIQVLTAKIKGINSISSLVSSSIDSIWEALNPQLEMVRQEVRTNLRDQLTILLEDLVSKIYEMPDRQRGPVRDATGRCRSEVGSVCDETARWFELPKELTPPQVNVGEMVELVAESTRRFIGGEFSPSISGGENLLVSGAFFSDFYDLLNLCFVNIVEHSGLDPERAESMISILKFGNSYRFECSNLTADDPVIQVERAGNQIEENKHFGVNHKLNHEGKSGLAKAAQILARANGEEVPIGVMVKGDRFAVVGILPSAIFATP